MILEEYVACICEGNAEQAVMDLLIKNEKIIFGSNMLLEGERIFLYLNL